jgi:hypothetical protein
MSITRIRIIALAAAALCAAGCGTASAAQGRVPSEPVTVWSYTTSWDTPVAPGQLPSSYFDVVLPPGSAGRWDTAYHLQLTTARLLVIWVHTCNLTPPGRQVAEPVFDGVRWQAWAVPGGQVTFALPYGTELAAVAIPARKWTYGTVHLAAMAEWAVSHGYLPASTRVTGLQFGFEFAQVPPGGQQFIVDHFNMTGVPVGT